MPWRRKWQSAPVFLPEKSHGQRSLAGYSPWDGKRVRHDLETAAAAAKSRQSCPTLCDAIDGSPPGSPIPGILQARTLEWVVISFFNAGKWKWSRSVVSDSSRPHGLQPTRLLRPWYFPGKSTGVGCHCLLWDLETKQQQNINNLIHSLRLAFFSFRNRFCILNVAYCCFFFFLACWVFCNRNIFRLNCWKHRSATLCKYNTKMEIKDK